MQLVMFSKHLGSLSVAEAGKTIRGLGFQGVDLTVRPGGHVLPEAVRTGLPAAMRTLRELGLSVPMITTGITGASELHAESVIATAAEQGIRELKLGYWPYRDFGTLQRQLDSARRALDGLEALARKHQVRVSVHVHSGDYLSAVPAHLHFLLKDRDPHHAGAYLDPGHMTLEGGLGGWKQGIDLLQGSISMVAVKSFAPVRLQEGERVQWTHKIVPLEEGTVRWPEVWRCLKQLGWDGVVTFHSEYQGSGSFRDLNVPDLVDQTRRDLTWMRPLIQAAGYRVAAPG